MSQNTQCTAIFTAKNYIFQQQKGCICHIFAQTSIESNCEKRLIDTVRKNAHNPPIIFIFAPDMVVGTC